MGCRPWPALCTCIWYDTGQSQEPQHRLYETLPTPERVSKCVCVCTSLVHEIRGSPPIFLQGDGGVAGELRPTKLSPATLGKRTCIACAWAPSWAAGGALIFVHLSSHFVLRHSFVSDVARGRNLTPDGSSHVVVHAILDVWHAWHKTSIS